MWDISKTLSDVTSAMHRSARPNFDARLMCPFQAKSVSFGPKHLAALSVRAFQLGNFVIVRDECAGISFAWQKKS